MERKSILLVDDDRVVRAMIKSALEGEYNILRHQGIWRQLINPLTA